MGEIIFFDTEVNPKLGRVKDFGAVSKKGHKLHTGNHVEFIEFVQEASFLCGHNIIRHDLKYLKNMGKFVLSIPVIDTLVLSPLLFPKRPYHKLVKDDKLNTEQLNNPLNDAIQAMHLFYDEVTIYHKLEPWIKSIYRHLLVDSIEFKGFFAYIEKRKTINKSFSFKRKNEEKLSIKQLEGLIKSSFLEKICGKGNIVNLIKTYPIELAYSLAIIYADDEFSITPRWVLKVYPKVEYILYILRGNPCLSGCEYCNEALNPLKGLKTFFGYEAYREFDGEALQEKAVTAAVHNKSLLAVFPTGGGKSITFQIPALMAGKATRGLTVIISPLQSLMKDQVDNLERKGLIEAVTINGLLDPIERGKAFERVENGGAKLLYISPESLRSKSIERLILGRRIERFVIDEAHCFSAWGQDFRVDYLYIADFIKNLYEKKQLETMIPVSCFTATAKQKVVDDIKSYFKINLNLELELFTASSARKNLRYKVIPCGEEAKYDRLRQLLSQKMCPTIVYVSRTKKVEELTNRLVKDGYQAKAYHGRMDKRVKSENQDLFIKGSVDIMVATSAFGMGVDKSDIGLVVHYQISSSLENYVQEAGRAGRDAAIEAECFILFDDEDLSAHFTLLNQTKLNINEIGQVWRAIKEITKYRNKISQSALEIARKAGWDESVLDVETRVRTAISALEQAGYVKRGQNMPRVFADSILVDSTRVAVEKIRHSDRFDEAEAENAIRIIIKLISAKNRKLAEDEVAESRIDYISDQLGMKKEDVLRSVGLLREAKILGDTKDLTAFINTEGRKQRALNQFKWHKELEAFLLDTILEDGVVNIKELNEAAEKEGLKKISIDKIITILNFWAIKQCIRKEQSKRSKNHIRISFRQEHATVVTWFKQRIDLATFILYYLYSKHENEVQVYEETGSDSVVEFSVLEIKEAYIEENRLLNIKISMTEVESALFYLSRIGALKIEGGFLVLYNALSIERLEQDNRIQYKLEDYKKLKTFYTQKVHQIHIVGEYARKILEDYEAALKFVEDYFTLNYQTFIKKYFKGSKGEEIQRNITHSKFRQLFGELSPSQLAIVTDQASQFIVVAAGPGSGKTRILVHKLAALLLMEDVKHEQLLMVTFSRAAATEFKSRLKDLIGSSANYIEIKTFHSFCFDLLGRVGDIEKSENIVQETARLILAGEVEKSRITKTVMVIDEAQDMDMHEFNLVRAMTKQNTNMRIIAVGDDDQNIYGFRGSDSIYMKKITEVSASKLYELVENYRSKRSLVEFTNDYVEKISNRMKSIPILPKQKKNGQVELIYYHDDTMMDGIVNKLKKEGAKGSICVLTTTNHEALQMNSRLNDAGFVSKLIQGNTQIRLKDMDEVHYFITQLALKEGMYTVDEETWAHAKQALYKRYARSENLSMCKKLLENFEISVGKNKYVTDFFFFLRESKIEDFIQVEYETIQVSTMHRSKGREFDTVIIILDQFVDRTDEQKRVLYVAMTRAKENLQIHYSNKDLFTFVKTWVHLETDKVAEQQGTYNVEYATELGDIKLSEVMNGYKTRSKLVFQLSYKDIFLSFYYTEAIKKRINTLMSGDQLLLDEKGCLNQQGNQVVIFSKSFKSKLAGYMKKGFVLKDAKVNMVIYWKGEKEEKEVKVVMPVIRLEEG